MAHFCDDCVFCFLIFITTSAFLLFFGIVRINFDIVTLQSVSVVRIQWEIWNSWKTSPTSDQKRPNFAKSLNDKRMQNIFMIWTTFSLWRTNLLYAKYVYNFIQTEEKKIQKLNIALFVRYLHCRLLCSVLRKSSKTNHWIWLSVL